MPGMIIENRVLPYDAMRIIQRASHTKNTEADPRAKEKAIDEAVAKVRRMYPDFFIQEPAQ